MHMQMFNKWKTIVKNNKIFSGCLLLLLILFATAILASVIAPHGPYDAVMANALQPPSPEYPFGTDKLGRCLFSRILFGMRASVSMALILVASVFLVGTALGAVAGYAGGVVDRIVMRLSDIMISFPGVVLAIAVAGMMGSGTMYTVAALAAISWTKYAKLSRSLVLSIKKNDYIAAAVISGTRKGRILLSYIIPNIIPTMIITAVMDIGTMMLELAGLSFLGFGAQPPEPEWGLMLNEGRQFMQTAPWLILYPGLAIILVVVLFNLLGDGLRDLLDPHQEKP